MGVMGLDLYGEIRRRFISDEEIAQMLEQKKVELARDRIRRRRPTKLSKEEKAAIAELDSEIMRLKGE